MNRDLQSTQSTQATHAERVLLLTSTFGTASAAVNAVMACGSGIHRVTNLGELLGWIETEAFAALVIDHDSVQNDAMGVVDAVRQVQPEMQLIWIVSRQAPQTIREALMGEAFAAIDETATPLQIRRIIDLAREHGQLVGENQKLRRQLSRRRGRELVGHSPVIESLREQIALAAADDLPMVITGESGTGKDLVARAIHEGSDRAFRPLIKIDCSLHTAASFERELFGASAMGGPEEDAVIGRLSLAEGGVLLLDHIDELPFAAQHSLSRALQDGTYQRCGTLQPLSFNVRCVATSRNSLADAVGEGRFREDLYQAISRRILMTSALREHPEDISQLTEHFLNQLAVREGNLPRRIPVDTLRLLTAHCWPGNVRELETLINQACTLNMGDRLTPEMVQPWIGQTSTEDVPQVANDGLTLREMERKLIESTFVRLGGNRERTAQSLQIGIRTLSGKLREYGYPPRGGPGSNRVQQERRAA